MLDLGYSNNPPFTSCNNSSNMSNHTEIVEVKLASAQFYSPVMWIIKGSAATIVVQKLTKSCTKVQDHNSLKSSG